MHNLPWGCTWQNLKDAFAASTQNIERADVIIDSSSRSRWASADHFWQPQYFSSSTCADGCIGIASLVPALPEEVICYKLSTQSLSSLQVPLACIHACSCAGD